MSFLLVILVLTGALVYVLMNPAKARIESVSGNEIEGYNVWIQVDKLPAIDSVIIYINTKDILNAISKEELKYGAKY